MGWRATAATAMVATVVASPASGACLTERQARELFPGVHLWWYGDHCWSDRRGGPPVGVKAEPVSDGAERPKRTSEPPKAAEKPSEVERAVPNGPPAEIFYPGMAKRDGLEAYPPLVMPQPWFAPESMLHWPLLLDVDAKPFTAWNKRIGQ